MKATKIENQEKTKTTREQKYRTSRILEIDEIIRTDSYPNATTLSKRFEVSKSTIQRDMDFLRDRYNAPLKYDEVKHGFYYTDKSFFVKNVLLTEGELFAISIMQPLLEQYRNTPLAESLETVFAKITEFLPDSLSISSKISNENISYVSDHYSMIDEKVFAAIFASIRDRHTINFAYKSADKTEYSNREADPLHVIAHEGDWYVLAFCHIHNEIRTFSLGRMKNVKRTGKRFDVPKGFDPKQYYDTTFGVWNATDPMMNVELLFEGKMENYLLGHRIHEKQKIEHTQDGNILVSFPSRQLRRVHNWILSFAETVKVLNPPELVNEVKNSIEKMRKIY